MKERWREVSDRDGASPANVSIERLLRELDGDAAEGGLDADRLLERALADVTDSAFAFDEGVVKHSLDELLLVLVALHGDGTHGKQLMDDLERLFDARLSPGTVYPRLHDLEAEGAVDVREMVRTKEYTVDDADAARERVRDAMHQHLAVGRFLQAALDGESF